MLKPKWQAEIVAKYTLMVENAPCQASPARSITPLTQSGEDLNYLRQPMPAQPMGSDQNHGQAVLSSD